MPKNAISRGSLVSDIRNDFIAIGQNTYAGKNLDYSDYEFDILALSGLKDALTPVGSMVSAANEVKLVISANTLTGANYFNKRDELERIFKALLRKAKKISINVTHLINNDNLARTAIRDIMQSYWETTPDRIAESFEIKDGEIAIYSKSQNENNNNANSTPTAPTGLARANQFKTRDFIQTSVSNGQVIQFKTSRSTPKDPFETVLAMTAQDGAIHINFSECKLSFDRLDRLRMTLKARQCPLPHLTLDFSKPFNGRKDDKAYYKEKFIDLFCMVLQKVETIEFIGASITVLDNNNKTLSFSTADLINEAKQRISNSNPCTKKITIDGGELLLNETQSPIQNNNNNNQPFVASNTTTQTPAMQNNHTPTYPANRSHRFDNLLQTLTATRNTALRLINLKDFQLTAPQIQSLTNEIKKINSINQIDIDGMDFNYTIYANSPRDANYKIGLINQIIEDFLRTILTRTKTIAHCNLASPAKITLHIQQDGNLATEIHLIDTAKLIAKILPDTNIEEVIVSHLVCNNVEFANYQKEAQLDNNHVKLKLQKTPANKKRKASTPPTSSIEGNSPAASRITANTASIQQALNQNNRSPHVESDDETPPDYRRKKHNGEFEPMERYRARMLERSKVVARSAARNAFASALENDHPHISISEDFVEKKVVNPLIKRYSNSINPHDPENPNLEHHQNKKAKTTSNKNEPADYSDWKSALNKAFTDELNRLSAEHNMPIRMTKIYEPKQIKRKLDGHVGAYEGRNRKIISAEMKMFLKTLDSDSEPENVEMEMMSTQYNHITQPQIQTIPPSPTQNTIPNTPIAEARETNSFSFAPPQNQEYLGSVIDRLFRSNTPGSSGSGAYKDSLSQEAKEYHAQDKEEQRHDTSHLLDDEANVSITTRQVTPMFPAAPVIGQNNNTAPSELENVLNRLFRNGN